MKKEIRDINKKLIKHGDRVYNRNLREHKTKSGCLGSMRYKAKEDWWYFFGDDGCFVGVPDFISDWEEYGVVKLAD